MQKLLHCTAPLSMEFYGVQKSVLRTSWIMWEYSMKTYYDVIVCTCLHKRKPFCVGVIFHFDVRDEFQREKKPLVVRWLPYPRQPDPQLDHQKSSFSLPGITGVRLIGLDQQDSFAKWTWDDFSRPVWSAERGDQCTEVISDCPDH